MQREPYIAPASRLARVSAAVAIVLGIFGMHALSLHPTGHEPAAMAVPVAAHVATATMLVAAASFLTILRLLRRAPRVWAVLHPIATVRITRRVAPTGTGPPPVWRFSRHQVLRVSTSPPRPVRR